MELAVIGAGHVGLVVASGMAMLGHQVVVVDLPERAARLADGEVGFHEPGLAELFRAQLHERRLRPTSSVADIEPAAITWVCVNRGPGDGIEAATLRGAQVCRPGSVLAVKSTMDIGACRRLAARLPADGPSLVYNPEFLRQGSALSDFLHPAKAVIGAASTCASAAVQGVLEPLSPDPVACDWETAELIKLAHNAFNALRISFVNELTMIATGSGASVEVAAAALVADVENLNRYLRPGFSYGGTCLSQSIESLRMTGMVANYQTPLLNALEAVNEQRFERTAAAILAAVPGGRVAIWGMTYKADVDDRIASPGATLAAYLAERGVEVHTYDPRVDNGHAGGYKVCASIEESLVAADALVATVAHPEFAVVPAGQILDAVGRESVFDLVGALPQLGVR